MKPQNHDWRARAEESFDLQAVMGTLGVTVTHLEPGLTRFDLPADRRFTQHNGYPHAGILTTVLDSACGYAAFTLMPKAANVLTVEFKVNFLRPASASRFTVEGRVLKPGKTLYVTEGSCWGADPDKPVARMTATMIAAEMPG